MATGQRPYRFKGVTMAKEFKTIDQLVGLLESRGVRTDGETATALARESYYAIVNGYKDPFLDRVAMQARSDDVFIEGTTFRMIYDLFLFDRAMRNALLPSLIKAESVLKNATVYAFCERHRDPAAYLDRANYVSAKDMLFPERFRGNRRAAHAKNLNDLTSRLNEKLRITGGTRPFIRHYLESYGMVPLWVLQNDLTFGNMSHFYQLQTRGVQNAACKIVANSTGNGRPIGARKLLDIYDVLVDYRNICAHDDRLYCAHPKGRYLSNAYKALEVVLTQGEAEELAREIERVHAEYGGRVSRETLDATGFHQEGGIV